MDFKSAEIEPGMTSMTVVPSKPGGKFIVKTVNGSDFVGDMAIVFGISPKDAFLLQEGDTVHMSKYSVEDKAVSGGFRASNEVADIDVVEDKTHTFITGVREFQEFDPHISEKP